MRRIVALVMAIWLLLSLVSCASSLAVSETAQDTTQKGEKTEEKTEETEAEKGPIILPEGFSVGFARKVINPESGTGLGGFANGYSRLSTVVQDDLMLTCTAFSDGEQVFLFYCYDISYVTNTLVDSVTARLEGLFDGITIPPENVMINTTHTHAAPALSDSNTPGIGIYLKKLYPAFYQVAEDALRDLSPATAEMGVTHTKNLNYVRRYVTPDGKTYLGNWPDFMDSTEGRHETEPDNTMQLLRFRREAGKDVVLCNWQCHPCSPGIGTANGTKVSSDWIGPMRKQVEKTEDVHFAFFQGAAGNLASNTRIQGEQDNKDYVAKGRKLAEAVSGGLGNMKQVETGRLAAKRIEYPLTRRPDKGGTTDTFYLSAFSLGEIAFATAPYEMHDTNGVQVKEDSPFEMTFLCAYTSGMFSYIPASFAFEMGGYEVEKCYYEKGTGEILANRLITLLEEIDASQK